MSPKKDQKGGEYKRGSQGERIQRFSVMGPQEEISQGYQRSGEGEKRMLPKEI